MLLESVDAGKSSARTIKMALDKYVGEQDYQKHKGNLYWASRSFEFPFRGEFAPLLTQQEIDSGAIEVVWDFHCKEFDLFNEKDKEEYIYIMDRACNGWFYIHHREIIKDKDTGRVRFIYLEWSQRYCELSPSAKFKFYDISANRADPR
jgi:hypothetical protein